MRMIWPWKKRRIQPTEANFSPAAEVAPQPKRSSLPTVKFNPKYVTDEVREEVAAILQAEPRLSNSWQDIYPEAIRSVEDGLNTARLAKALQEIGWTSPDSHDLAHFVHFRSKSMIDRARQMDAGIKEAKWMYCSACHPYGETTPDLITQDELHQAADGKRFLIAEGLFIDGRRTWPGMERHCKCLSRAIVTSLS